MKGSTIYNFIIHDITKGRLKDDIDVLNHIRFVIYHHYTNWWDYFPEQIHQQLIRLVNLKEPYNPVCTNEKVWEKISLALIEELLNDRD